MILQMTRDQIEMLEDETSRRFPLEACALLFGVKEPRKIAVRWVLPVENVLKSQFRFEVDPKVLYDALIKAEGMGLELIGFFHSHPAPPEPSSTDLKYMELWDDAVWLIMSSGDHSVAAYITVEGEAERLKIEIKDRSERNW